MAPANPHAKKKAAERAALSKVRAVTITLEASEEVLQRLAAMLLFTDPLKVPKYTYQDDDPMPWDEGWPPEQSPLEASVDFEAVRRSIAKYLGAYVKLHGEDRAREVLRSFGAERLSAVPEAQLLDLNAAFEAALNGETEKGIKS